MSQFPAPSHFSLLGTALLKGEDTYQRSSPMLVPLISLKTVESLNFASQENFDVLNSVFSRVTKSEVLCFSEITRCYFAINFKSFYFFPYTTGVDLRDTNVKGFMKFPFFVTKF
jgi:hypothetical protein